jgi:hypothetical protein
MLTYVWVGVFRNKHGVVPKTIHLPIQEFSQVNATISKHVKEWEKDGFKLVSNQLTIEWSKE